MNGGLVSTYRCKGEKEWTVFRLRGGDRRIRECNATVGTGDKPRFEKLEPLRTSAKRILDCEHVATGYTMKELVHAAFEDEGSSAATTARSASSLSNRSRPTPGPTPARATSNDTHSSQTGRHSVSWLESHAPVNASPKSRDRNGHATLVRKRGGSGGATSAGGSDAG